ncbi:hypothetical protein LTR95_019473, partial [Oleoguttula sp. CCFEE 5521]
MKGYPARTYDRGDLQEAALHQQRSGRRTLRHTKRLRFSQRWCANRNGLPDEASRSTASVSGSKRARCQALAQAGAIVEAVKTLSSTPACILEQRVNAPERSGERQ